MPRVRSIAARRSTAALSAFVACAMAPRIPAAPKRAAESRKTRGLRTSFPPDPLRTLNLSAADPSTTRALHKANE